MSDGHGTRLARRKLVWGALGALGLAIAGGVVYEAPRLLRRRYKPSKFDDLLDQLSDRDSAARLGVAVIALEPGFDARSAARRLRDRIGRGSLARAVAGDIAQGRLTEVQGWLLPESLVLASAIAARAS